MLYATYAIFVLWCVTAFGDRIAMNFAAHGPGSGWFEGGIKYAGYNLAIVPAVLFSLRHITTRQQALTAGLLGGPIGMIPAMLFFVALVGYYPEIGDEALPANFLIATLDAPWFHLLFQVVIFGTFVETGSGFIHSVNERIAEVYAHRDKAMPKALRPAIAAGVLVFATFVASAVGIVDLIAKGYTALTYVFLLVYVLPVMTVGVWLIRRRAAAAEA